jgi:putative NIF3 family GTP cyclohydrolase 1 type 2
MIGGMTLNTKEIMQIALDLAGITETPVDSAIINEGDKIKKILIGVDMDTPELIIAKQMGFDLVISHHPHTGSPEINFHNVMLRQIDKMVEYGVPINKAQKALSSTISSIERGSHTKNYDRVASFAKLIGMPYMNIHMPCDIITENYLQIYLNEKLGSNPKAVLKDVIELLDELPEYQKSIVKPVIRVGSDKDYAGKIAVLMAGGTNGGEKVYKAYFDAGVGTIICMHVPNDVRLAVVEQNIGNVIVAGHMPSDSIGINIFINELEKKGLEVTSMSGIMR